MRTVMKKGLLCAVSAAMTEIAAFASGDSEALSVSPSPPVEESPNPNDAMAYNNRGLAYYNKGDNDCAIEDYNEALRLDPNEARAYRNRGNAYMDKGDNDRAIADFTQALRLDPNNADAYHNRGNAYSKKKDYARACADWEKALQLDPNNASARNNLEVLRRAGY